MSIKSINRSLNLAACGMISIAVCVGAWGWLSGDRLTTQPLDATRAVRAPLTSVDKNPEAKAIADDLIVSEIWSRPLRGGFRTKTPTRPDSVKPPVVVVPPAVNQRPNVTRTDLGLRLVGTVLEGGNSMAIAIDRQGKLDFRKEGELFDLIPEGVRVESVLVDSIRVTYQGQDATWRLGESLTLNESDRSGAHSQPAPAITEPEKSSPLVPTRRMTLEEELDFINGDPPKSSF